MLTNLRPALQRFLEAASVAEKWRVLGPLERTVQRKLSRAFRRQGVIFMEGFQALRPKFVEQQRRAWWRRPHRQLRETITSDDWLRVFDTARNATADLFFGIIQEGAQEAMQQGALETIGEVDVDVAFNLAHPRAVQYLDEHGYGLISNIDDVTRDNLATIISNGAEEGWSYNRMAREIISLYSDMAGEKPQQHIESRAHLIAVTEVGNAYETGGAIVVQDLQNAGLTMEKKWLTVGDDRVSAGCKANQDEGWIPFSQAFSSGHQHPLRFPGCRCTTLYQRKR
jgi:Phage Mu protein F like protein